MNNNENLIMISEDEFKQLQVENENLSYNIFKQCKNAGNADFIQVYPNGKLCRLGNTGADRTGTGGVNIEVNTKKELDRVRRQLVTFGFNWFLLR